MICLQPPGNWYEAAPIRAGDHGFGALSLMLGSDVMVSAGFAAVWAGVLAERTRPF